MAKSIPLPNTNLYLHSSGLSLNGNKVVKVSIGSNRSFSIQTAGNLPKTSSILRGLKTYKQISEGTTDADLKTIGKEIASYVKKYGSDTQKSKIRTY